MQLIAAVGKVLLSWPGDLQERMRKELMKACVARVETWRPFSIWRAYYLLGEFRMQELVRESGSR